MQRLQHDGEHGCLKPEQQSRNSGDFAERGIGHRQGEQHAKARQHEQHAGDEPAPHSAFQPAGIGGELHGLRPGQQHAEIQGMQEALLVEPFLLVDQDGVHQRDLPGWPAEGEKANSPEYGEKFAP